MSNLNNNHWLILGIIALTTALFSAQVTDAPKMHFELLPQTHIAEAHEGEFFGDVETRNKHQETEDIEEEAEAVVVLTTEEKVRAYFADIPVMQEIARCESRFTQYDSAGRPLRNMQGSSAIGVMQIMSSLHKETARKLGHDIETLEGNMGYARYLYEKNGTRDWNASRHCWGNKQIARI